jgi:hypothetical protein
MDTNNWVCNNCYSYEIPKYLNGESARKRHSKHTFNLLLSRDSELIEALINEARWSGDIKTESEKQFIKRLCYNLKRRDIIYETEKPCETGIIDIFIPGDPPAIVEAKMGFDNHSLMSALGQLLFYSMSYPDAQLFVAIPKKLPPQLRKIFSLYDIRQWGRFTPTHAAPVMVY